MNYLETVSLEATLRDYEFTRMADRQIHRVVTAESFQDMSAEEIFHFLLKDMQLVSFKDYLKRYLYERSGMTEPFRSVDDRAWQEVIAGAFEENNAPHSFTPTTTKWNATIKHWLNSERVRRSTVFLLGFGLRMSDEDVTDFLIKVLREDDFRMDDPHEAVYRYCFVHGLPYAEALRIQEEAARLSPRPGSGTAEHCLKNEAALKKHLAAIRGANRPPGRGGAPNAV